MNRYGNYILFGFIVILFFVLMIFNDRLVLQIAEIRTSLMPEDQKSEVENMLSERFDYNRNGDGYMYTFLEFGSTGRSSCRQMQEVMKEIKASCPSVNVVFIDVALKENLDISEYFGIAAIPTQVLLDKSGKEYYRHTGFIPAKDLAEHF